VAEPAVTPLLADRKIVPTRFAGLQAAPALLPLVSPGPYRHLGSASPEAIEAVMRRVWPGVRDAENRRVRGARILLSHLGGFPGGSWQQRWEASGLNETHQPVNALIREGRKEICTGAACLFGLRVIRPSLLALRSTRLHGYGERFLTAQHDPLLEKFWKRVQDHPVHPMHHTAALFDVAVALPRAQPAGRHQTRCPRSVTSEARSGRVFLDPYAMPLGPGIIASSRLS
jgi:hypothetical protein